MLTKEDYLIYFNQISILEHEIDFITQGLLQEVISNELRQKILAIIAGNHKHIKILKYIVILAA